MGAKMKRVLMCLGAVFSIGFASLFGSGQVAMASTYKIVLEGAVSCSYHPLSGVWVQSSGGGSGWAHWDWGSKGEYDGDFSLTITTALPTNLSLHIGCGTGGTPGSWWSDNYTPTRSIKTSVYLNYNCNEGNGPAAPSPGVRCSAGATRSELAAIQWAEPYVNNKNGKDGTYDGYCLQFVTNAYTSANVNLQSFIVPQTNGSTYPQFIWQQFKKLQQYIYGGPGIIPQPVTAQSGIYGSPEITPPPGALVFFNQTGDHDGHSQASGYYSHVELSLGGDNMISTADTVNGNVHYETLAEHAASGAWNTYVGWWLPA